MRACVYPEILAPMPRACQQRVRIRHELGFVALQQDAGLDDHPDSTQPHHALEAEVEAGLLVPVGGILGGVWCVESKCSKLEATC